MKMEVQSRQRGSRRSKLMPILCCAAALMPGLTGDAPGADPPLMTGAWTLVHIPDTQNYVSSETGTSILNTELSWIVAQKATRNIKFAVQVGDLVNDNGGTQWNRARSSFDLLNGQVPLALCSGNHDCGSGGSGQSRETQFAMDTRFGLNSSYGKQATVGGYFQHPSDPPGDTQNSWHTFEEGGQRFLVLTLEWGPRDEVVAWMESLIAARPWYRVIIVCHAYLASGSARQNWTTDQSGMNPHAFGIASEPGGVNDGEELWQKLAGKYENVCLVCCGHAGQGFRTVTGVHGNKVHEMLYNTQDLPNGGNGWLRLLEFYPDGRTVRARTYSTHLNQWDESAGDSFTFQLSPVSSKDSDSDGMPDWFESTHGLDMHDSSDAGADPDHDGATSKEEHAACTSPRDAASAFAVQSFSLDAEGGACVAWTSVPGMKYQLQRSASFAAGSWSNAGSPVTASRWTTEQTAVSVEARQYFRVMVLPP